jgi:hypothetical protein
MSALPQVINTDLFTEPLDRERAMSDGHFEVRALTARHLGRDYRLTDACGEVVKEVLA